MKIQWITIHPGETIHYPWQNKHGAARAAGSGAMHLPDGCSKVAAHIPDNWTPDFWVINDGDIREKTDLIVFDSQREPMIVKKGQYTKLKHAPLPKEMTSILTKGSKWKFDRDWVCQGYNGYVTADPTDDVFVVPAGTEFTVTSNKIVSVSFRKVTGYQINGDFRGIPISTNSPVLESACKGYFGEVNLPTEAHAYVSLVEAGKTKTFWKMEYDDGTPVKTKRYDTLSAVKASIRMHAGLVKTDGLTQEEYESYGNSQWVVEVADNVALYNAIDLTRQMFAVKYDHATKKELEREDLSSYLTFAKISTP